MDCQKILIEVINGKNTSDKDTFEEGDFRKKLVAEVAEIKKNGGVIDIPQENPDMEDIDGEEGSEYEPPTGQPIEQDFLEKFNNQYPSRTHRQWHGLDGLVETAAGTKRKGRGRDGRVWASLMPCDYGELSCATGTDGDNVDCYWIGDEPIAHIVEQHDPPGSGQFDEHKILLGAPQDQAVAIYCKSFSDGKGFERIGKITEVTVDELKAWLAGPTHIIGGQ